MRVAATDKKLTEMQKVTAELVSLLFFVFVLFYSNMEQNPLGKARLFVWLFVCFNLALTLCFNI